MDSNYLKENVGVALTEALAATALAQPEDPIEFLAKALINHVNTQRRMLQLREERKRLEEERDAKEAAEATARARAQAEEMAKAEAIRKAEEERVDAIRAKIAPHSAAIEEVERSVSEMTEQQLKAAPLAVWTGKIEVFRTNAEVPHLAEEIAALRRTRTLPAHAGHTAAVLSLALYMLDLVDEPVEQWKTVRGVLKEEDLAQGIAKFEPLARQRVAKFRRVERRLNYLRGPDVQPFDRATYAGYFVHSWLELCVGARKAAATFKATKLNLQEEAPITKAIAPGDSDTEDTEDEEIDEEEDLQQVVEQILRTEREAEEMEAEAARRRKEEEEAEAEAAGEGNQEDEETEDDQQQQPK